MASSSRLAWPWVASRSRPPRPAAPGPGTQDEEAGDPLQFGEHVRGQQHRHAVGGHRRQHRGHKVGPGDRIEHRHRLIQHQQPRQAGQRQGQRQLGLLAARQLPGLPLGRDAELVQPGLRVGPVEAPVQAAGHVDHVRDRQVLVQRRVLRHERDPVQRGGRPGSAAAEHGDLARRRRGQADRQVQQRGLAGPVGPTSAATCPAGIASVHSRSAQVRRSAYPGRWPPRRSSISFQAESGVPPPTVPGSRPGCLRPQVRTGSTASLNPGRLTADAHGLARRYVGCMQAVRRLASGDPGIIADAGWASSRPG